MYLFHTHILPLHCSFNFYLFFSQKSWFIFLSIQRVCMQVKFVLGASHASICVAVSSKFSEIYMYIYEHMCVVSLTECYSQKLKLHRLQRRHFYHRRKYEVPVWGFHVSAKALTSKQLGKYIWIVYKRLFVWGSTNKLQVYCTMLHCFLSVRNALKFINLYVKVCFSNDFYCWLWMSSRYCVRSLVEIR